MDPRKPPDDRLLADIELAQSIVEAWVSGLAESMAGGPCPGPEALESAMAGTPSSMIVDVVAHLPKCSVCRERVWRFRLLQSDGEHGVVDLQTLLGALEVMPDRVAGALGRVASRLSALVMSVPPESSMRFALDIPRLDERGDYYGEDVPAAIARGPRIDSRYRLTFEIRTNQPLERGTVFRIGVRDAHGRIDISSVAATDATSVVAIDLSTLPVRRGYLAPTALAIFAHAVRSTVRPKDGAAETRPLPSPKRGAVDAPAAAADNGEPALAFPEVALGHKVDRVPAGTGDRTLRPPTRESDDEGL